MYICAIIQLLLETLSTVLNYIHVHTLLFKIQDESIEEQKRRASKVQDYKTAQSLEDNPESIEAVKYFFIK